ncbi:hypothetical protein [Salirhabdus sp. Marseille-P4669]|uniref:hypothetical protein n=1 Tax=Salirhabdus sp. Marseille-P4669 TaxID=2042310 RepID=UPI000C7C17D9|nr:hypothetical protein [Salirhabdus sp. Marseille-P4669]
MKKLIFFIICIVFMVVTYLILTDEITSTKYAGALSVEEIVELNPNADYFELDGGVYIRVEWADKKSLTLGDKVGEIKSGMANKLPDGTIIYSAAERSDILIAIFNGKEKRYIPAMGE